MIKRDRLPNGMTVITEEIGHANSIAMGLWVRAGARYEHRSNAGICHFLEHMNFKGTEKRSAKEIAQSLEHRGGQLNAYTAKEYTSFYCQVLGEDYLLAMDVLSDLFLHSLYRAEDIDKERNVVLEEIKLYEDSPDELVLDILNSHFWGEHSLGMPILGFEESVAAFHADELISYRGGHYLPRDTVFAAAGNLRHEDILAAADKLFAGYSREGKRDVQSKPEIHSGNVRAKKDIEQEHVAMAVPGLDFYDPAYYTLILINEALGGGASSRLFQTIREEMGLSYSVFSFINSYTDNGMLGIYAGTGRGKGEQVSEACFAQLEDIRSNGLYADELKLVKEQIKGNMLIGTDSIASRLSRLGRNQFYYDRIIPPEEVVDAILSITNEEVIALAERLFRPESFAVATVIPQN